MSFLLCVAVDRVFRYFIGLMVWLSVWSGDVKGCWLLIAFGAFAWRSTGVLPFVRFHQFERMV